MYKYRKEVWKHMNLACMTLYYLGGITVREYVDRYGNHKLYW